MSLRIRPTNKQPVPNARTNAYLLPDCLTNDSLSIGRRCGNRRNNLRPPYWTTRARLTNWKSCLTTIPPGRIGILGRGRPWSGSNWLLNISRSKYVDSGALLATAESMFPGLRGSDSLFGIVALGQRTFITHVVITMMMAMKNSDCS